MLVTAVKVSMNDGAHMGKNRMMKVQTSAGNARLGINSQSCDSSMATLIAVLPEFRKLYDFEALFC